MDYSYWHKQERSKPLYPDIEWSKPEQRSQAGRLGIIGGNKLGFTSLAASYSLTLKTGIGQARVLLPDSLRKVIPPTMTDVIFAASNPSGSLSSNAWPDIQALDEWASGLLLIGDAGRNSETAILYEKLLHESSRPLIITRDAIDLVLSSGELLANRPHTVIVASFAQVQKLFRAVYYPKILTFSMQLMQLVEALHKFTVTYPLTIVTFHADTLIVASNGEITTTPWIEPLAIWKGDIASRAACYYLWNEQQPLRAITASIASN